MLFSFENCGSFSADNNPLTDLTITDPCIGTGCSVDITSAGFTSNVAGILLDQPTGSSTCDASTCFDVGGYCETGGYPGSYFTYQWVLANGTTQSVVSTSSACDGTGRFRLLVQVPSGYDYTATNMVRVSMIMLDSTGAALTNPAGTSQWTYTVTTRSQ